MKKSSIIALLIIAAGIALMVSMVGDYSTYETFASSKHNPEKEIHVVGFLSKEKPMSYDPLKDANCFEFFMKDKKGEECKVVFKGNKPQDFEKSEQIVLTGKMVGNDFHASSMLMKCPSKYTNDKIETKEFKANS